MKKLKDFQAWETPIYEAIQEEDEWIIRKLRVLIKRAKKIPTKQRWHILVGFATTLLTLNSVSNLDYIIKSIGSSEFTKAFQKAKEEKPALQGGNIGGSDNNYSFYDLNDKDDYKSYAVMCQIWIDNQSYNLLNITGEMLAEGAKKAFNEKGIYVPFELALAQLTIEGGFRSDPNLRPIRTRNPFNLGNDDAGNNRYFDDVQQAIDAYYRLIAGAYLGPDVTVDDLVSSDFVRKDRVGKYAGVGYGADVAKVLRQIKKYIKDNINED